MLTNLHRDDPHSLSPVTGAQGNTGEGGLRTIHEDFSIHPHCENLSRRKNKGYEITCLRHSAQFASDLYKGALNGVRHFNRLKTRAPYCDHFTFKAERRRFNDP